MEGIDNEGLTIILTNWVFLKPFTFISKEICLNSSFKDLLENQKIEIVDEDTILEISTFVAKGQSYEASQGNHDDLVMNFIMFSYFSGTIFFNEITDINIKQMMFEERMQEIENDVLPFGFIDDGLDQQPQYDPDRDGWAVEYSHENF